MTSIGLIIFKQFSMDGRWIFYRPTFSEFNDRIFTKSNHASIIMIEKKKNHIMNSAEDKVLHIDKKGIEQYLTEVKEAVESDRYRIDRNCVILLERNGTEVSAYILF